jgi:uncharacterized protein YoxC
MLDKLTNTQKWILGIVGIISTIGGISWGMANFVFTTNATGAKANKLEVKMDNVQKALGGLKTSQDSLKTVVLNYATKADALQNSYVLWVQEHSATINDVVHSLQGMTFEFVTPEKSADKNVDKSSVKPSAIIRVVPTKPIKK